MQIIASDFLRRKQQLLLWVEKLPQAQEECRKEVKSSGLHCDANMKLLFDFIGPLTLTLSYSAI